MQMISHPVIVFGVYSTKQRKSRANGEMCSWSSERDSEVWCLCGWVCSFEDSGTSTSPGGSELFSFHLLHRHSGKRLADVQSATVQMATIHYTLSARALCLRISQWCGQRHRADRHVRWSWACAGVDRRWNSSPDCWSLIVRHSAGRPDKSCHELHTFPLFITGSLSISSVKDTVRHHARYVT